LILSSAGLKSVCAVIGDASGGPMSGWVIKNYVCLDEFQRGQTMTEYVMVLVTIAIAAVIAYQSFGTSISAGVTAIAGDL
jgi:Flp pilus assembly pilin Flp